MLKWFCLFYVAYLAYYKYRDYKTSSVYAYPCNWRTELYMILKIKSIIQIIPSFADIVTVIILH